jgi:hypothetical protein
LPGSEALRGHLLALRSLHAYLEGQAGSAVALAEQALQRLPVACVHAHVTAQALLAGGRQAAGDLAGARDGIRQALAHAAGPIDACQAPLVATCVSDRLDGCRPVGAAVDGRPVLPRWATPASPARRTPRSDATSLALCSTSATN